MRRLVLRWLAIIFGASLAALVGAWGWSHYRPVQQMSLLHIPSGAARITQGPTVEPPAPCTGTGRPEEFFKIVADAAPLQPSQYSLEELPGVFPAFKHKPFDSAGFYPVMLPLAYFDPDHLGDANEAMALTALISDDLDWSPGCYCDRHAYFVFKRDRKAVQGLMRGYESGQIASFTQRWGGTHAIGGELIRTAGGYQGRLQIFNPDGAAVFARRYDVSQSFWALLGDMDVDAMTFLDVAPPQVLVQFLHQPRCAQFQSVVDLGSAALVDEKSPEEFAIYAKILRADPGFAMVRHWYANQKHWTDGDNRSWTLQNGLALASRPEITSFEEFQLRNCPNAKLAAQLPQWLDQADRLCPDHPRILACRLDNNCFGSETRKQLISRGLKVAAQYPNSYYLLVNLGLATPDKLMAASLFTASLLDHYSPGTGEKGDALGDLAFACDQIGRDDVAMEALSAKRLELPEYHLYQLLRARCRGGRYVEAADLYPLLGDGSAAQDANEEEIREQTAPCAAFAAFMTRRAPLLDQILHEQSQALAARNLTGAFHDYADCLAGKSVQVAISGALDECMYWRTVLLAAGDAQKGTSTSHSLLTEALFQMPAERLLWIAQDDYQRRDPSADGPAFYEYLAMLFSYDPWVRAAVSDFHKRGGVERAIDSDMLLADLQQLVHNGLQGVNFGNVDWKHVPTPWRVAACVDQLLKQNKTADAADIADLYDKFERTLWQNDWQITIAAELVRRVKAAQTN